MTVVTGREEENSVFLAWRQALRKLLAGRLLVQQQLQQL
jgi:hypothetical protein